MVLPEYQHCGIGRKIIETLEERAAEFGEKLDFDGEYDWGEQMGREVWLYQVYID